MSEDTSRNGARTAPSFTSLTELASSRVGGRALAANDDFFASKSNLVKAEPAIFVPGKYTSRGKWMDGWESRRRRTPGHDWCVVALGMRGIIHGVNVDTRFFTGNFPSHCSIDAVDSPARASGRRSREATLSPRAYAVQGEPWTTLLAKSALQGDGDNFFVVDDPRPWTHVRLNIHPDGGVARLRVYGAVVVDWARVGPQGRAVDLAAIVNGGLAIDASDRHYGNPNNMLMPGRASNMGGGWETRRRRGPGHDWAIIRLGAPGVLTKVEIDTNHYKGNYPDSASIDALLADGSWAELLPQTRLRPHYRHTFSRELRKTGAASQVRLNIFPDGGVSRLRVYGHPTVA